MNLKELAQNIEANYQIDQQLYIDFNVKRGLRNKDGSGVLVGITRIGGVTGFVKEEEEIIPVQGKLRYRGIEINDIVSTIAKEDRNGFEEIAFLLLFGKLPNLNELNSFKALIDSNLELPAGFKENMILKAPSKDIMNKLARSVLALYSYDENPDSIDILNVLRQSIELIARFPAMIAYGYQAKSHYYDNRSLYLHNPEKAIGIAENFLRMIRPNKKYTELEARTLDISLILHAEHGGGNNSAFTTHVVTSSDTDTYSAISAAIGSLKGPKHGGANNKVMGMMENIKQNVKNWEDEKEVSDYIVKILRKEANDQTGLVYGIGHAVYTLSDPRAIILKKYAYELAKSTNSEKEFILYDIIERVTPKLFNEIKDNTKVVAANVDFYSGFVYNMLCIPPELYTPIFAMARIAGWCAHRIEEIIAGGRIIRPAYKNLGTKADYIPMKERK
ncbi:MAG: citrate/2-methylcitrate synthase [Bacteroidales bacterium]|nr:citrate/2-methylcitrate synthase [Bacteroidales bacterium]